MDSHDVLSLIGARRGHFVMESGYHGTLWLDLDELFWLPSRLDTLLDDLAHRIAPLRPDLICGPLTGGAFVAFSVATKLNVGFRWTFREEEPLNRDMFPYRYRLGGDGSKLAHQRAVVVDDVINAGSATRETLRVLREKGTIPVAVGALLALGDFPERLARHEGVQLLTLTTAPNTLWLPDHCPLCAAGEPLQ